jgi:uncharacterized protein YkwD
MHRRDFIFLSASSALLTATPTFAAAPAVDPAMLKRIYAGTNHMRDSRSIRSLRWNNDLNEAANRYAAVLAKSSTFSHTVGGSRLPDRVSRTGYRYRRLAENIGWAERRGSQLDIADWFVSAWMDSPGHRRNMLDNRLHEIGVGVAMRGRRYFAVQVFGKRK